MGLACSRRTPATNIAEEDDWEVVGGAAEATTGAERGAPQQATPLVIDHHRVLGDGAERPSEFWLEYGRNLRRLEREIATQVQIQSYSGSARAGSSLRTALRLPINPARARWLRARLKIALLQCIRRRWSRAGAWLNLHPVRGPVAERVQVDPELRGRISRAWSTCGSTLLPQYRSKEIFGHLRKNRARPLRWESRRQTAHARSSTEGEWTVSAQDSIHASGLFRATNV